MNWKQIDNYCTNNITRLDVFVLCKLFDLDVKNLIHKLFVSFDTNHLKSGFLKIEKTFFTQKRPPQHPAKVSINHQLSESASSNI